MKKTLLSLLLAVLLLTAVMMLTACAMAEGTQSAGEISVSPLGSAALECAMQIAATLVLALLGVLGAWLTKVLTR